MITPQAAAVILGYWLVCHTVLWGLWRFGMREMAFFRLVLEVIGEKSWLRWPLGLGCSLFIAHIAIESGSTSCVF